MKAGSSTDLRVHSDPATKVVLVRADSAFAALAAKFN